MNIDERLSKAKAALVLDHPFWASLALGVDTEIATQAHVRTPQGETVVVPIPTAATDGRTIWFNPGFVESLNDAELLFLLAHEVGHPMLAHIFRRQERDFARWNRAADYVLNQLLVEERIGRMPAGGLYDQDLVRRGDGTAEGVYVLLDSANNGKGDGPGGGQGAGGALDECMDAAMTEGMSEAELSELEAEWKMRAVQAANAAKMAGALSDGVKRLVSEVVRVKEDYWKILQDFLVRAGRGDRTYARPNRRFISQGLYCPAVTGQQLGEVVFAVDCSGSIGPNELNHYAARIRLVHEDMRPTKLHVVYFDSQVCHADSFEPDNTITVEPHGGGGTAFSPVFRWIQDQDITPEACVFLTDLCCIDFGPVPDYPVLWITTGHTSAPFGQVVRMEL